MSALYNENNPYAAQWLKNLVDAGHIAPGAVSAKSIVDLEGRELAGFRQAHFFAGIGIWSAALRAAGWPDSRRVWTGSCPCQPFSGAGQGNGFMDERHLWPAWFWLIEQHRPDVVFGEQVEGPRGRAWLDLVFADLEALGYICGAAVFPAASVGAPHGRHRTFFVADADFGAGRQGRAFDGGRHSRSHAVEGAGSGGDGDAGALADADGRDAGAERLQRGGQQRQLAQDRRALRREYTGPWPSPSRPMERPSPVNGVWRDADWIFCRDGKWRPVEPGTFPLAHGAPARVGFVCAACLQADSKGADDEVLRALRETDVAAQGSLAAKILQSRMHGRRFHADAADGGSWTLSSAEPLSGDRMHTLQADRSPTASASQRQQSDEQRTGEYRDSLRGLSRSGTQEDACSCCGQIVDWLADAVIGSNRTGRLRAYGNAVVLQQAQAFIEAFLDLEALSV